MSKSPNPKNTDVTGIKPIVLSLMGGVIFFCVIDLFIQSGNIEETLISKIIKSELTKIPNPSVFANLNPFRDPFQIFGGGIKNACLKFDEEMSANLNVNPIEMVEKINLTNKKLMDAVGITYYEVSKTTFDLEKNQSNIKGLIEASEKCKKEGVILDGVNN